MEKDFNTHSVFLCVSVLFISRVAAGQSPGSLIVRPNRSQFFEYESVSLSCEVQGGSTGRRVERNPTSGKLTECGDGWGRFDGTNCIISSTKSTDSGVYWCGSGKHKNTVNITVTDGHVILESPALPVTEGFNVTLKCRNKTNPSDLTADFYKNGTFIRTETTGEMTIPAVSQSDEGLYSCRHSELGRSPESWMTVTAATSSNPTSSTSSPPPSSSSSLLILLSVSGLAGVSVFLIILLVLFCYRKKKKGEMKSDPREVTYTNVRIKQEQKHGKREKCPGTGPVYSEVAFNTKGGASAGPRDVTYGQLEIRTKKKEKPLPLEPDDVYTSVRPAAGPSKKGRV
ncbi:low affinity immunoglobulin gamma Fc region receptor II-c-like isoform X2 [Esox lucius]|uniref:low affinity immunoglobulin gamma Fc region receptor II-c-like isoform X2 n=1 Tax=Esox lucius TaxID=8010 RepID=UPI0014770C6D|nr:low affinity immunoglobulin gamma Fc region receptor II-c-like isoform X2 [Esox lucius]